MANEDKQPVNLTRGFAKRVSKVVKAVEGDPVNGPPAPTRGTPFNYGSVRAVSTSNIPAGTFNSPGTGYAKIAHKTEGSWEFQDEQVAVYNQFGGESIEENTPLFLSWVSGDWYVSSAGCEAEDAPIIPE